MSAASGKTPNYGSIILPTSAGPMELRGVANPRALVDVIIDTQNDYQSARKAPADVPIKDNTLRQVIEDLAKPTIIAPPTSPDPSPGQAFWSRQRASLVGHCA